MKSILTLVIALYLLTISLSQDVENPFVKVFNKLHQLPPNKYNNNNHNSTGTREDVVLEAWIEQKLDNFDENNIQTWQMRFLMNTNYFKPGGPIFIFVGGEWTVTPDILQMGHFYDLAKEHNAMLFYTEHRFFGRSLPFSETTVENMRYLTMQQALADLAHFINNQRSTISALAQAKVILHGCSYSGDMVVWFKRLYPELMVGGWASSAPVLAKADFYEFKEVEGLAFRQLGSAQCYNRIQNGIADLEYLLDHKRAAEVKAMIKLCSNFDEHNDLDVWMLLSTITNTFTLMVQFQSQNDVALYCDYLMQFEDDLTAIMRLFLDVYGQPSECYDISYKTMIAPYLDTKSYNEGRTVQFQLCDQFGWFPTTTSKTQPFGTKVPLTFFTTFCADVYGRNYTNENIQLKVSATNSYFGGKDPQVEHIYVTQGGLDPWMPAGLGEAEGATVIPRASHCADLGSISANDSAEMLASKLRIAELVREWLA